MGQAAAGEAGGGAMRAYSQDLRERIVAAIEAGESQPGVARRFGVGVTTVGNYLRLRRATGGLAPRPRPGGQPEIPPARYPVLRAQLEADPDATLAQHCATWAETQGQVVSVSTMWRTIARLGWTHKKNAGRGRAGRGGAAGVAG
jgi:transposase